jgi:cytochrome c biogenesis protein CcdA
MGDGRDRLMGLLESTAFGAALVFGFRHGFDWDHLAALTDLTGSQARPRRGMFLATLYALGHAAMILLLGVLAIVFTARLPTSVDSVVERFVGASLIVLGVWIAWTAVRTRGAPPMRSRWMLLITALRRAFRRARPSQTVVIEHDHDHGHGDRNHGHAHDLDGELRWVDHADPKPPGVAVAHGHRHRHVVPVPQDPFISYDAWSSFGIGMLHGIGAETPTQVLLFAAAANATNTVSSLGLLLCFIIGLVAANTVVAALSTLGFRTVLQNRLVMGGLAAVTAAFSLTVGTLLLAGHGAALPAIFGG